MTQKDPFYPFDPHNWFWIVGGDESRLWSSAAGAYVMPDLAPPQLIATRILDEAELAEVLSRYGLSGPAQIVPKAVTPYQARLALSASGLRDAAEGAIAAAPLDVRDAWEYALTIERASPFIAAIGAALDLSEAQIDQLFVDAAAL